MPTDSSYVDLRGVEKFLYFFECAMFVSFLLNF